MLQRGWPKAAVLILLLLGGAPSSLRAADTIWKRIRYQGGTIEAKVNPFDWNTTLRAGTREIQLTFAGQKTLIIPNTKVTSLTYGERAFRRVSEATAQRLWVKPLALFGVLHQTTGHLIGIQFTTSGGKAGAVLLDVHKADYSELLDELCAVTGRRVDNRP